MEIITLLRQYETRSWEYVNGRERFVTDQDFSQKSDSSVYPDLLGALNGLRSQFVVIRTSLNSKDFKDLWRTAADGVDLDHYIFFGILASDICFSSMGTGGVEADMRSLYTVAATGQKSEAVDLLEAVLSTKKPTKISFLQVFVVSYLSPGQIRRIQEEEALRKGEDRLISMM